MFRGIIFFLLWHGILKVVFSCDLIENILLVLGGDVAYYARPPVHALRCPCQKLCPIF